MPYGAITSGYRRAYGRGFLPTLIYTAVSLLVLWHLLMPGYVLTFDMVFTPNIKVEDFLYGFERVPIGYQGGISAGLPYALILKALSLLIPTWLIQKALLFLALFLAGLSAHRLCPSESQVAKYFSGMLYMLNPFVYVRFMAGNLELLLAYAVMPFAVKFMVDFFERQNLENIVKAAFSITLAGIFLVHNLFLLLLVFLVFLIVKLIQHRQVLKLLRGVGLFLGSLFLLNVYWILPSLTEETYLTEIGYNDLSVFTAKAWGSGFNILFSLASMHGFWRGGYNYIVNILPGWYLIFFLFLFLAVHGFKAKHKDGKIGPYVIGFGVVAVFSLVLGAGISSLHFSGFFEFLFNNIPVFKGFRDSQKFVALLVLAYSFLGGLGVADISNHLGRVKAKVLVRETLIILLVLIALMSPFVYSLNMLFGFNGQLSATAYPEDWYEVNRFLNEQEGDFKVLFLPWHWFMTFSWVGRNIVNPAPSFFDKPVVGGENVEVDTISTQSIKPSQHYIQLLLDHRDEVENFGELVAPLGMRYILLAKEVDYQKYGFLYNQKDLKLVLDTPSMAVFENTHETAILYWTDSSRSFSNWGEMLQTNRTEDLMGSVYIEGGAAVAVESPRFIPLNYTKLSPVDYRVEVPEWGYVVFSAPYHESWMLNGEKTLPNMALTNAFHYPAEGDILLHYGRFDLLLACYAISGTFFTLLLALVLGRDLRWTTYPPWLRRTSQSRPRPQTRTFDGFPEAFKPPTKVACPVGYRRCLHCDGVGYEE